MQVGGVEEQKVVRGRGRGKKRKEKKVEDDGGEDEKKADGQVRGGPE